MAAGRTEGLPRAYRFAALLIRPWLMLLTKREWRGAEHLPRAGGFVVSPNHISYADPLPFAHYMFDNGRGAYFLAKESVFRVRGVGWVLRKAGPDPRPPQLLRGCRRLPLGGRRRAGGQGRRDLPRRHDHPGPRPVAHAGQDRCGARGARDPLPTGPRGAVGGPGDPLALRSPPVTPSPQDDPAVAGPPVDLDDLYGRPIDATVLREATDRLMDRITELLEQVRGETPAD